MSIKPIAINWDWLNLYLKEVAEQKPWAVQSYQSHVGNFLRWLDQEKLPLGQITHQEIHRYLATCKAKRWEYCGLIQRLSELRRFFRFLQAQGLIKINPADNVACAWVDIEGGWANAPLWLKQLFSKPAIARRYCIPFLSPYLGNYIKRLLSQGYKRVSVREILVVLWRFHRFIKNRRPPSLGEVTYGHFQSFVNKERTRRRARRGGHLPYCKFQKIRFTLSSFLDYAFKEMGLVFSKPSTKMESKVITEAALKAYGTFCRVHRGLKDCSIQAYCQRLRQLGIFLDRKGILRIQDITQNDLDAFVLEEAARLSRGSFENLKAALRSFFGYLFLNQEITTNPAGHLVWPSRFSADLRPKYLPWPKIQSFLASIDRHTAIGKRDYAILLLLAAYGLRSQEAARLALNDIDWENKRLTLRERKGGRAAALPLRPEVEGALRDYLETARPKGHPEFNEVFLTLRAPIQPLGHSLCCIVGRDLKRYFGHSLKPSGAYVLRHSFAKALLDKGAPMTAVRDLLGHRSLETTLVYTRIATEDLREMAQNYAQLL